MRAEWAHRAVRGGAGKDRGTSSTAGPGIAPVEDEGPTVRVCRRAMVPRPELRALPHSSKPAARREIAMQLGFVGLGTMGAEMVARLTDDDHRVLGFDVDPEALANATARAGAEAVSSLEELVAALDVPRAVWVMLPHGTPTESTIDALIELLDGEDVIVDGGNSRFTTSEAAAERAAARGIDMLDVGVSGGVWGRENGYCLMVGGSQGGFRRLEPIFSTLAPEAGYAHVGASGAGHFVKMVHNAIEYAQLQALGEGFGCLEASSYDLDLSRIASLWQHGAVVRSWLLELLLRALDEEGDALSGVEAWVEDSGMGRWSVEFAVEHAVPVPAIASSLFQRFSSRDRDEFSARVIAALRNQFGGHAMREVAHE
jgi:6-phosphogluconate dehydrogenase